jgi:hypothetical protein
VNFRNMLSDPPCVRPVHACAEYVSFNYKVNIVCQLHYTEEEGNTVLLELCAVHGTLTAHFEMTKKIPWIR